MSFQQIQLTNDQLAELYGKQLVVVENDMHKEMPVVKAVEPEQSVIPVQTVPVTGGFTGKNKKHFMWLVEERHYPYLDDADFQFLSDVLNACKMNMEDIALVNVAGNRSPFEQLVQQLQPKYIIAASVQIDALPIQTADYKVLQQQTYQLCYTESLEAIRTDKTKKSKLWLALKQMLGL
ncbi:MAG: hypothetical protein ACOVP7_06245 [Lacibacter sp.]